jgi:tetratricopeptide (TPR) repeat protein
MKLSKTLVKLAKEVVSNLAAMGLDDAGKAIFGERWVFFSKVLKPVIDELAKRFPDLFINKAEAAKAAKEIELSPELMGLLENTFNEHFAQLKEGQDEILFVLLQQSEILYDLKTALNRGDEQIKKVGSNVEQALALLKEVHTETPVPEDQIALEVDALQRDAMQWIDMKRPMSAQRRLDEARKLIRAAVDKNPLDIQLLNLRGYLEKSQAQLDLQQGNIDNAHEALNTAANYFNAAHKANPDDPSALNGLANTFYYVNDFDTAAHFSKMALERNPRYAEAAWDLALSLEEKLKRGDGPEEIISELITNYNELILLIPGYPGFTADQLAYVQTRLAQLEAYVAQRDAAPAKTDKPSSE